MRAITLFEGSKEYSFYIDILQGESHSKLLLDQKQLENVESFKYLGNILANDGRCTCEIKCRIAMTKAALNKKRTLFTC